MRSQQHCGATFIAPRKLIFAIPLNQKAPKGASGSSVEAGPWHRVDAGSGVKAARCWGEKRVSQAALGQLGQR